MHVLVVMADILFKARISSAAEKAGSTVAFARTAEEARTRAAERAPDVVIGDLALPAAWEALGSPDLVSLRRIGLYHHVDGATREKALAAGIEPMPNGEFVARIGELLR